MFLNNVLQLFYIVFSLLFSCCIRCGKKSRFYFWRLRGKVKNIRVCILDGTFCAAYLSCDSRGVTFSVGGDSFIGASHFVLAGNVEIGSNVYISWGCEFLTHNSHSLDHRIRRNETVLGRSVKDWSDIKVADIFIGDDVWICCNAIILPGIRIGKGSIIAAGAVVTRNVPEFTLVGGNPAVELKRLNV